MAERQAEATEFDGDLLLPGELPTSSEAEDAAHWAAVYAELVEVLVGQQETSAFRETLQRYRQRLVFWQERLHDLSADR
jgi:hypothetical protein